MGYATRLSRQSRLSIGAVGGTPNVAPAPSPIVTGTDLQAATDLVEEVEVLSETAPAAVAVQSGDETSNAISRATAVASATSTPPVVSPRERSPSSSVDSPRGVDARRRGPSSSTRLPGTETRSDAPDGEQVSSLQLLERVVQWIAAGPDTPAQPAAAKSAEPPSPAVSLPRGEARPKPDRPEVREQRVSLPDSVVDVESVDVFQARESTVQRPRATRLVGRAIAEPASPVSELLVPERAAARPKDQTNVDDLVEISIGSINLHVQAPPRPLQPPPPLATPATPAPRVGSNRLQRHFVR